QASLRHTRIGSNWPGMGLALLSLLISALMYTGWKDWKVVLSAGGGGAFAGYCLLWWCRLLASLARQNFPSGYFLLPRMRQRSVIVLAAAALPIVAANTLLFAVAGESPSLVDALAPWVLPSALTILMVPALGLVAFILLLGHQV